MNTKTLIKASMELANKGVNHIIKADGTIVVQREVKAAEKWIQKAIKKPGALHKDLGVPEGEKIPVSKLKEAAKKGGKLGKRARLALTLKGLKK